MQMEQCIAQEMRRENHGKRYKVQQIREKRFEILSWTRVRFQNLVDAYTFILRSIFFILRSILKN